MKVAEYYTGEEFNTYRFGQEPQVELGNKDSKRDLEFESKFEELNEYYMKLASLGIKPLMWEITGTRHKTVDYLLPAWKKVVEMADESWSISPYGDSWYSSKEISWDYKPEGSIRIADHWNFSTRDGKMHCQTTDGQLKDGWAVGKFVKGKYEIMEVL